MTITDQIKILNNFIMQNEAQYDLDRKAAKISALSCNNLDKYKYLADEDLGLKPNTIEQAKFEYSPLGKIFNKGLDKNDQKEGLFKRLKNIEGKNEEQLKLLSETNKTSSHIKMKMIIIMTIILFFTSFTEIFKILKTGHSSLNTMR